MSVALKVKQFLRDKGVDYQVVAHPPTHCSSETAESAHVPGDRLIKSVILQDEKGYMMAVLPSTHRVELGTLYHALHRNLGLATEFELLPLLKDCAPGAIPPLGPAYEIETIVDQSVEGLPDVYFEAGDHEELIHMRGDAFLRLMEGAERLRFTHHT